MPAASPNSLYRDLERLWDVGATGPLSDGQLIERFVQGDKPASETAFASLVDRHGAMVLGTCRRIVGNSHDADDAFQATFIILARRANSLRIASSLAPWLYGVASRVARDLRRRAIKNQSRPLPVDGQALSYDQPKSCDISQIIDDELARLPHSFRTAVVLCDLEGSTIDAAAKQLGWPLGTMKSRLARGRDRLRASLTRRGLSPDVAGLNVLATPSGALINATIRAASVENAVISHSILRLVQGASWAMMLTKIKLIAGASVLVLGTGMGVLAFQEQNPRQPAAEPNVVTTPDHKTGEREVVATHDQKPAEPKRFIAPLDADKRTQIIYDKLNEKRKIILPSVTTFGEAVIAIAQASRSGPDDPGIPISINPVSLADNNLKIDSPITVILKDDFRLYQNLERILNPHGLHYDVFGGLLSIDSKESVEAKYRYRTQQAIEKLTKRVEELEKRLAAEGKK